ncbi:hypothetical protein R6Q57_015335 [Mikania cordata]
MAEITSEPEITTVNDPLLSPTQATVPALFSGGYRTLTRGRMLLSCLPGRRGASMVVRENVALELDDYLENWSYSFPFVITSTLWNLSLVVVALAALIWTAREETDVKIRIWICGYAMQCVVHVVLLLSEYRKRNQTISTSGTLLSLTSSSSSSEDGGDRVTPIRRLETLNIVISYMWWIIGFIWMMYSYVNHGNLRLFWLVLAFLAMDMFFLVFRILTLVLLSAGYCFCLPCIIATMVYLSRQESSSLADINGLPRYTFKVSNGDVEQPGVRTCRMIPMRANGPEFCCELDLPIEDADCCVCLFHYEDKEELHLLACRHHFHSKCIKKWLRVKTTCPVCKSFVGVVP